MVGKRTQSGPPSYVGKQRSDETSRFREAGFGYRPTLTSNAVTMRLRGNNQATTLLASVGP
jgi:hypothetical protein